jgi:putative transposase
MVRTRHLAKSIIDAGWSQRLSILVFQAAYAGKRVVAAPADYASPRCSGCGVVVQKGLSVRRRPCPECRASLRWDHNAARIKEGLGQSLRGPG